MPMIVVMFDRFYSMCDDFILNCGLMPNAAVDNIISDFFLLINVDITSHLPYILWVVKV